MAVGAVPVVDLKVVVDVVRRERDLRVDVEIFSGHTRNLLGNVELADNFVDVLSAEERVLLLVERERVLERLRVEELVGVVDTGVDDGDLAAGAGVTLCPDEFRTDHGGGNGDLGLIRFLGYRCLVFRLDNDLLDAESFADGVDLVERNVGGNDVARNREIPDHVEFLASENLAGNSGGNLVLLRSQIVAVADCLRVAGQFSSGEARFKRRLAFKDYRDPDGAVLLNVLSFESFSGFFAGEKQTAATVVHFSEGHLGAVSAVRSPCICKRTEVDEREGHRHHGQQRQCSF